MKTGIYIFLGAAFLIGAVVNFIGPGGLRNNYVRWGYPSWFNYVNGALELLTGACILVESTRIIGMGLAAFISIAAATTLVLAHETKKIIPSIALLVIIGAWFAM